MNATPSIPTPKVFQRPCTLEELELRCAARKWPLSRELYDAPAFLRRLPEASPCKWPLSKELYDTGLDYVCFRFTQNGVQGICFFSPGNGKLFGRTDKREFFTSGNSAHNAEPWFQALLETALVE